MVKPGETKAFEMPGLVGFDHYRICCIVGMLPHEREQEQEIYVDLRVEIDFSAVAASDLLQDTVDYVRLAEVCRDIACQGKYSMLERYAVHVLDEVLKQFAVTSAWIRVKKPKALAGAAGSVVELKRIKG